MFVLVIVLIQAILFLAHFIIFGTFIYYVAPTFSFEGHNLIWISLFFFAGSLSFIISWIFVYRRYHLLAKRIYQASAFWLGTVFFLYFASVLVAIFRPSPFIAGIIFLIACLVSIVSVVNSFAIDVKTLSLQFPNTPENWKGKKAVMFADAHLGNLRGKTYLQRVADLVESRKPDIVFLVGDLYDGQPVPYHDIISPLKSITTSVPWGVYFVTGNHEEFEDPTKYLKAIESIGIKILDNQAINIMGMNIWGVDYKKTAKRDEFEKILKGLKKEDEKSPTILLKHVPANVDLAEAAGVDLSLHGHTHDGQIWPLGYIARNVFSGYENGLKKFKNMDVYTTSGVGTWGPPQRFFTRSEIVEIIFR